jgi:hypothetical protein
LPVESEGDHSTIGIDFDFGALTSQGDLSGVDPGHAENCNLVWMDVKASTTFIDLVKKKTPDIMQLPECIASSNAVNEQADVLTATDDSTKISAMSCISMQRQLKRNARKLAGTHGHEC